MNTAERRATAALWSVQGVGPVTLGEVQKTAGPLGDLLEQPVERWASSVAWRPGILERVLALGTLAGAADRVEAWCRQHHARVLFPGDPAFPSRLIGIPKAPSLLFARGPACDAPPRRRLAIVGTRTLAKDPLDWLRAAAKQAARAGVGIVSGAAYGTDQAAHAGALDARGETWAFLGSALDQIDSGQVPITVSILEGGGTLFSEYPPGSRSNTNSFTLRNRLISGASDAVLVFRAPVDSGALHTARAAIAQQRTLLVTPGEPWDARSAGSNALLQSGAAAPHIDLGDLLEALGLDDSFSPAQAPAAVELADLSEAGKRALALLELGPSDFDALVAATPELEPGQMASALAELELCGAVLHKDGRRYEKR